MDDGSRLPLEEGHVKKKSGIFDKLTHIFHGKQQDAVTEKEIISMVDEAHEKGVLHKDEAEMIQNIFAFEDKEVGAVMTHRSHVAAFALDDLLKECDIISLHLTANDETYHFMDAEKFAKMKPGSVLINTARGSLVDSDALIDALEQERLAGAGLDVLDEDRYIYYRDHKNTKLKHHQMAILQSMPNVLMLPHLAYFTDQALEDMVHNSLIVARDYFLEHP